jgi:hypothetical protein
MSNHWQHIRALLARRIRYRITRGGVLFTIAVVVVGVGTVSANNLLFLIVAAMISTLLVSGLVAPCLAGLNSIFWCPSMSCRPQRAGQTFVRNHKWLMPFLRPGGSHSRPASPTLTSGVYFPLMPPEPRWKKPWKCTSPGAALTVRTASPFDVFPAGF